eukprot:scaffold318688_cov42-Prasinocladus_malaysianus.AAC.1
MAAFHSQAISTAYEDCSDYGVLFTTVGSALLTSDYLQQLVVDSCHISNDKMPNVRGQAARVPLSSVRHGMPRVSEPETFLEFARADT